MNLYEQLLAILYHLLVGQVLGLCYSFVSLLFVTYSKVFKTLFTSFLSIICTLIYYYGLYKINNGIMHLYLFILLFVSFYIYYIYFYGILIPAFTMIKRFLTPFKRKTDCVKKKIYDIIVKQRKNEVINEQKNKEKKTKQNSISF